MSALFGRRLMEEVDWSGTKGQSLTFPTFSFCFLILPVSLTLAVQMFSLFLFTVFVSAYRQDSQCKHTHSYTPVITAASPNPLSIPFFTYFFKANQTIAIFPFQSQELPCDAQTHHSHVNISLFNITCMVYKE